MNASNLRGMPRTEALIEKLSAIHPKGFDLSLERIATLLSKLGNPQKQMPPAIHVAGTNGKGSTLAFCRAILEAAGYRVHVHTSPHLVNWNERYRLAGKLVDDDTLANAIENVVEANADKPITIFEIMSAVMFLLFSEHDADYCLVEVGLGGRFDATNVLENTIVSAITPIALDHQAYLGDTIEKIAFEKAGIIKQGVPVVVGPQEDAARDVIEQVAISNQTMAWFAHQDFDFYKDATGFVYQDESGLIDLPMPRLSGEHQLSNAALAIASIRASGITIPQEAWATGMKNVNWSGRLEKLPKGKITQQLGIPDIWIDGGHNPAAGTVISDALKRQLTDANRQLVMVCGMINTKDPIGYFKPFVEMDAHVITIPVSMSDAGIEPQALAQAAQQAGLSSTIACQNLEDALEQVRQKISDTGNLLVLFGGSLYMVGEILARNETPPI